MLLSYKFSNFQSFVEEVHVSLTLDRKTTNRAWQRVSPSGELVSTALGIFGANAAGKTALLKPVAFIGWFITESFSYAASSKIPLVPHFSMRDKPTMIEIEADDEEGIVWRYKLVADKDKVIHESLYKKKSRFSYVFIRDLLQDGSGYSIKQQDFGFSPAEAKKVRQNASLLSTATQYGVELAEHITSFNVVSNIGQYGRARIRNDRLEGVSEFFAENDSIREKMVELLKSWDLGLDGVAVEKLSHTRADGKEDTFWTAFGEHITDDGRRHRLSMIEESSGTQSAYVLLSSLLFVLEHGGLALIDEMESDLHPALIEPILELFDNAETNTSRAQLLFTCHSQNILNILQKSQVLFVEKRKCASEAFRGDEISGLRSDDNLRSKYESGSLGAVPRI